MRAFFLIPGDLTRKTGGYGYDRRVMADASRLGVTLEHIALPAGFPFPNENERAQTISILRGLPQGVPLLIDGLAFGAFDQEMLDALKGPVIALVHHPLAYENGIVPDDAARLKVSERAALACANGVIVTSAPTKAILIDDYQVPPQNIQVAIPGTDAAPQARGSGEASPVILGVGSLTPRKAWNVLIDALAQCIDLKWRMVIAGEGPERDGLEQLIASRGLEQRISLVGEVSEQQLHQLYDSADLFVMPSLYEGFGMALTEALARGLPCIASDGVVALQHLPLEAALSVKAGDVTELASALRAACAPDKRAIMAQHARESAQILPRWDDTARTIVETIRSVAR